MADLFFCHDRSLRRAVPIVAIASRQGSITNTSRYDLWKEHGHSGDSGIGWGDCYL